MERNSNLRNQNIYRGTMKDSINTNTNNNNNNKVVIRDSWRNVSSMGERSVPREDVFPWPPRSYTCSFCKREFRSAQALGGHMNVHRRDRARLLRQSPPRNGQFSILNLNLDPNQNLNPNPNQNPKPNFSSSTSSILFRQPFTNSNLPPLVSSSSTLPNLLSSSSTSQIKKWCRTKDHMSMNSGNYNVSNKRSTKAFLGVGKFDGFCIDGKESAADVVRLNLEIGIFSDSKSDLDLELRLGQS